MARNDGRIEKGQSLRTAISAKAWNRAQEAADRVLGAQPGIVGGPVGSTTAPYTWVYAKNTSGSAVARWGVMKITGVEVTPTSDGNAAATKQFEQMPVLTCGTTGSEVCVAIDPIDNDKIGRVAVSGTVQVKAADAGKIAGVVLWKNDDWALVRFGGGIRLGRISATWTKGSTATVTQLDQDGSPLSPNVTFDARNWFATVTVSSGTKKVSCAQVGSNWILIAAEC